ncbi:ligand-gated ion channel-domain-containing protein [Scenedesmus sp. NREL 46B-D3]|nr:ligand-gated ion channel-domain-containing protein [Scenedesmus sp. NREL 46B-D3]
MHGYQVELFRMLAQEVGWEDGDYAFTCMKYSDMLEDLKSPTGLCSLSAAGVEVSVDNLASNLKFSWPTYKSGLRVMISAHLQQGSTWAFSQVFHRTVWLALGATAVAVFHWTVWLALGGTAVAVGFLVALIEWATPSRQGEVKKGWQAWSWYSLSRLVHVLSHVGDPSADASRILMLGYGFLVLVMVSMYTATSASRITAEKLVHPVHGKKDLPGREVWTWSRYTTNLLDHHGIAATGRDWNGEADKDAMIAELRAGAYDALVLDAPVLEYTVGTNADFGEPFETFSLALAFPADFNDSSVFEFSASIVRLQTYQGALDMLENVYVKTGGTSKCFSSDGGGHGSGKTIQLSQVSGLWYILLIAIGLCFVLTLIHNARKDPRSTTGRLLRKAAAAVGIGSGQPQAPSVSAAAGGGPEGGAPVARRRRGSAGGGSATSSMDGFEQGPADERAEGHKTLKAFLGVSTFAYRCAVLRRDLIAEEDAEEDHASPKMKGKARHAGLM